MCAANARAGQQTTAALLATGRKSTALRPGAREERRLLRLCSTVRILEARFHPHSKKSGVGSAGRAPVVRRRARDDRSRCRSRGDQLHPFDPNGLIAKLNFLVQTAIPRPYEGLTALRSDYWSFVDVPGARADHETLRQAFARNVFAAVGHRPRRNRDAVRRGEPHQIGRRPDRQLPVHVGAVGLDGLDADTQPPRDLLTG